MQFSQFAIDLSCLGVTHKAFFLFTDYLLSEVVNRIQVCSMFFLDLSAITSKHIVPALHSYIRTVRPCKKINVLKSFHNPICFGPSLQMQNTFFASLHMGLLRCFKHFLWAGKVCMMKLILLFFEYRAWIPHLTVYLF